MITDKKELRAELARIRERLHSPERDVRAVQNFLTRFGKEESFFIYRSFRTETDTRALCAALLKAGKRVCLPKLFGTEMRAVPYTDKLVENAYGIEEPTGDEDVPCAVTLVPLLAADEAGYRLGYGGGFYDRYFAAHPRTLRVGLCYAGQVCRSLPADRWDIPLQAVVTEEGVRIFDASIG